MRAALLTLLLVFGSCAPQPVYRRSEAPLPVASIDLGRFLGLWYEQARLPNRFEYGCQVVTVRYARHDGGVSMTNTCTDLAGDERVAHGRARLVGEGKFEVSAFGPFWSDHWVLDRGADYSWAIVGEPDGKYLWVLTRQPQITPEQRAAFEQKIRALGYRPADLVWAAQSDDDLVQSES